jgi:hypothetical protein
VLLTWSRAAVAATRTIVALPRITFTLSRTCIPPARSAVPCAFASPTRRIGRWTLSARALRSLFISLITLCLSITLRRLIRGAAFRLGLRVRALLRSLRTPLRRTFSLRDF